MNFKLLAIFLIFSQALEISNGGTCHYLMWEGKYHCELKDAFVILEDSPLEIDGHHLGDFTDENVHSVTIKSSVIHYLNDDIFKKFPNLEELHLINVEIFEIKPTAFSHCDHLHKLSIEDEDLKTLPSRVFQNCSVINEITIGNHLEVLPDDVFYGADSLVRLNLENNKLEKLPELSYLKNLEYLNLGMNKLEKLEDHFEELINLKSLNLAANNLSNSDLNEDTFANLKNLEELILHKNLFKNLIPKWFENLKSLNILDLSDNHIEALPENSFINLNFLKILYLDSNEIYELETHSFGNQSELRILTVDNNNIYQIDRDFFDKFIKLEYFSSRENECFNGFILGGNENPIDFENDEIADLLGNCFYGSGGGFKIFYLWIGLGVAVLMCILFLTLHFLYERSNRRKVEITE